MGEAPDDKTDSTDDNDASKSDNMQTAVNPKITKVKNIDIEIDPPDRLNRVSFKTRNELIKYQLKNIFKATDLNSVLNEVHSGKARLERLGVFSLVTAEVDVHAEKDGEEKKAEQELDVLFRVKEKGLAQIKMNANADVTQAGGAEFGGEGTLINLRGLGESLRFKYASDASSTFQMKEQANKSYEISYSKPLFLDPDKLFQVRVQRSSTDFALSGFNELSHRLAADLNFCSQYGRHVISWEGAWRENLPEKGTIFGVREHAGHTLKSAVKHSLIWDTRNCPLLPLGGSYLRHSIELAGLGGNARFLKSDVDVQLQRPLGSSGIIFGSTLQAGAALPLQPLPLAITDRFFLGGMTSVRGFEMQGIGAHAGSAPLGGEAFWSVGAHLYSPLPFRPGEGGFGDRFKLHAFANAGNIGSVVECKSSQFLSGARASCGVGCMMNFLGMVRLELNYCVPMNPQIGDRTKHGLQVGVGVNFL